MKTSTKRLLQVTIFVIIGSFVFIKTYNNYKQYELKHYYQQKICVLLERVQLDADYLELGSAFADVSSLVLGSYLDKGEWENCSYILLGGNSHQLFQESDDELTKREIEFLTQLKETNEVLLNQLPNKNLAEGIYNITIVELKEILNRYHLNELKEFVDIWQ